MTAKALYYHTKKFLRSNSPELLTGTAVAGVFATGFLSARAGYKAALSIDDDERLALEYSDSHQERIKQYTIKTWRFYIPAVAAGATTVVCIVSANRIANNRIAAGVAAYSLANQAFSEYRDKVIEEFGETKEQKIRDDVAADRVEKSFPTGELIIAGSGQVLCCELYTERYFRSDMETLRKAQNDVNQEIINGFYATLDYFYDIVGLSHTTNSSELGWDVDRMMELNFTTTMAPSNEPCIAFDYNYIKPLD